MAILSFGGKILGSWAEIQNDFLFFSFENTTHVTKFFARNSNLPQRATDEACVCTTSNHVKALNWNVVKNTKKAVPD